jgi:predicted nucleic acid-binding protein
VWISFAPTGTAIITAIKVIDASALIAVVFSEPGADLTAARLSNARLIAPVLLDVEFTNICLMKYRRKIVSRTGIASAQSLRAFFTIDLLPVDESQIFDLADATGLTAYDASYLWLARKHHADLVTLDKQLAAAHSGA